MSRSSISSRAPLRLDLAGGWTDVAPFSAEEGGAVCSVAIARYQVATFELREVGVRLVSGDAVVEAPMLDQIPTDRRTEMLAAALRRKGMHAPGELRVEAGAPPGSGLGSSGALGVALMGLMAGLRGEELEPRALAVEAYRLEVEDLGVPGGIQDQFTAALGGFLLLEFAAGPEVRGGRLAVAERTARLLASRLVLCYGGQARLSGNIIDAVMSAYRAGRHETCAALRSMKALAGDAQRALLSGDLDSIGEILAANWRAQKDLHYSVSNPDLERLFDVAAHAGATGGKALGAGGGGCVLFYCPGDSAATVARALNSVGAEVWPVDFDYTGVSISRAAWPEPAS